MSNINKISWDIFPIYDMVRNSVNCQAIHYFYFKNARLKQIIMSRFKDFFLKIKMSVSSVFTMTKGYLLT